MKSKPHVGTIGAVVLLFLLSAVSFVREVVSPSTTVLADPICTDFDCHTQEWDHCAWESCYDEDCNVQLACANYYLETQCPGGGTYVGCK
jgi:hypothetical protein